MKRTAVLAAGAWFAAGASSLAAQTVNDSRLVVRNVERNNSGPLDQPTAMAFIGDRDLLILEKATGHVLRLRDGRLHSIVLDVAVDSASERGLLGIAVHPGFPDPPYVYLYFTESSTGGDTQGSPAPLGNRVYRYSWNGSNLTSPTLILALPVLPGANHDGGTMTFGPDGKLYVVIGDLNRSGQLQNNRFGAPPDDTSVIFRINDDGSTPSDNPFAGQGGNLARYFAYGIRNSFGLAFDPVTGWLWDTENGPATYDEINLVTPGFNSGWLQIMGPDGRDPQGTGDLFQVAGSHHYADPRFSWLDTVGPTGLAFVGSRRLGLENQNDLFVGDVNNGDLYHFEPNATRDGFVFPHAGLSDLVADNAAEVAAVRFGTGFPGGITDVKVGPDGGLYILTFSGELYRIARPTTPADFDGDLSSDIVVFRNGAWMFHEFETGLQTGVWTGLPAGCTPTPMDYDGDGDVNFAFFCLTGSNKHTWHFYNEDGTYARGVEVFATTPGDIAVPADYDGDGRDDMMVYRNGAWVLYGLDGHPRNAVNTGLGGARPVPMDYDGDGPADFTAYVGGAWYFFNDNGTLNRAIWTGGVAGDIPVPADYDGDGDEDIVIFRNGAWLFFDFATGAWNESLSVWTGAPPHWHGGTPLPAPLDHDGDGDADFTVFSGGPWHFYNDDGTYQKGIWTGGVAGDQPISRRLLP